MFENCFNIGWMTMSIYMHVVTKPHIYIRAAQGCLHARATVHIINRFLQDHGVSNEEYECPYNALCCLVLFSVSVCLGSTQSTQSAAAEAAPHTGKENSHQQPKANHDQNRNLPPHKLHVPKIANVL